MSPQTHLNAKLEAALIARFSPLGLRLDHASETPWASVTFSGARHHYAFSAKDHAGPDFPHGWDHDLRCDAFNLPGHILADIIVSKRPTARNGVALLVEALTVEAA
jgi:hypothetical protein